MDKVESYTQSYSQGVDNYVTLFAKDVIRGVYGSGETRKNNLYNEIQHEVNKLL